MKTIKYWLGVMLFICLFPFIMVFGLIIGTSVGHLVEALSVFLITL